MTTFFIALAVSLPVWAAGTNPCKTLINTVGYRNSELLTVRPELRAFASIFSFFQSVREWDESQSDIAIGHGRSPLGVVRLSARKTGITVQIQHEIESNRLAFSILIQQAARQTHSRFPFWTWKSVTDDTFTLLTPDALAQDGNTAFLRELREQFEQAVLASKMVGLAYENLPLLPLEMLEPATTLPFSHLEFRQAPTPWVAMKSRALAPPGTLDRVEGYMQGPMTAYEVCFAVVNGRPIDEFYLLRKPGGDDVAIISLRKLSYDTIDQLVAAGVRRPADRSE